MLSTLKAKAARVLGHAIQVVDARPLSPNLRSITFEGPALRGMHFEAGMKIKLGVESVLRSYTPSGLDPVQGRMHVVFHLHGLGAAATWAARAKPGDSASFLGPAASIARRPDAPWALFFGDETTLGLARALVDDTAVLVTGAVELAEVDLPAVAALGLPLTGVARASDYGSSLLDVARRTEIPGGDGVIWVSGHAGSVRVLWDHFLGRDVPRARLCVKPYWSDRGATHRKSVAKQLA